MRFVNLHVRTAALAFLILAAGACQTAQHPVALVPPATAPSLKPAPAPASSATSGPAPPPGPPPFQPAAAPVAPQQKESRAQPASTQASPALPADPVAISSPA